MRTILTHHIASPLRWPRLVTCAAALLVPACESSPSDPPLVIPPSDATVVVDHTVQYQTMTGWQAVAEAGHLEPGFYSWQASALDKAVDMGLNRLRIDVRSGAEHTRDMFDEWQKGQITQQMYRCLRYGTVNDNSNPAALNAAGYHWTELDTIITRVVNPMRQRLAARGEVLGVTITYIAFVGQIGPICGGGNYEHTDPEEYAEYAVALMTHVRDKFGFTPDTWEILNEQENSGGMWPVTRFAPAISAIDRRLKQAGFNSVTLIAPSNANAEGALSFATQILASPAGPLVGQIGYHRYGGGTTTVAMGLGSLSASHGISTAMTEHIGSGHEDLMIDLTLANASTWDQFTLAYPTTDNSAQYLYIEGTTVKVGHRARYLRQFFRHARRGAVRIKATSKDARIVPVAFRNTNSRMVVVMNVSSGGDISVGGLAPGKYGIGFETESIVDGVAPDVTVGSSGEAVIPMPAAGVIVLYARGS